MINFIKCAQKRPFTIQLFFAIALFAVSGSSYGQLLQWNTFGNAGTETNEPSVFNNATIGPSDLTLGTGVNPTINANRFGGNNWFDTGNTATGNTIAEAVAGNNYIQFVVTPNDGYSFTPTSFVFNWDKTAITGPPNIALRSSIDGFTTDLGIVVPTAAMGTSNTITISGLINITTATTFRLYGYGATGTSGTGGFDFGSNVVNVQLKGTTLSSGPYSIASGDWNAASTWSTNSVPANADFVTIKSGHTVYTSTTLSRTGKTDVNGAFQLNAGGWASGMDFTYGATGTLNFNSGESYNVNDIDVFWPLANGPFHVNVLEGGLTLNSANRTVAGNFATAAGVTLNSSTLSLNGIAQINTGGFFTTAPIYGNASTLIYNTGGIYGRGTEWSALGAGTIEVTPGYPNHVQLSGNTTFNYNNGSPLAKAIAGNLTIDAGSGFYMDYGGGASGGAFTITGNLNNAGNFTLGNAIGDDLKVGGDFTNTGIFNGNNRAIYFTKPGVQNLTSASSITIPYLILSVGTTVKLATGTNAIVSAPNGGNAIQFTNSSDVLDINGNTLTIGTAGIANTINGSGTFKGSASSNLTLKGIGSIGRLEFAGDFNLGTLTVDRQAANVAFTLGADLSLNNALILTNGLIDLGSSVLTLEEMAITSGASPNSFVITDLIGSGGMLRKQFTTFYSSFTFPIGDSPVSADGSQYSPASVSFESTTTYSTSSTPSYVSVAVNDIVHPNLVASTDYISRYWSVNRSGIFTNPIYTFAGTYLPIDRVGTAGNCVSSRWNGTSWTDGSSISSNTVTMSGVMDLPTAATDNHFSAGYRNQEINIKGGTRDIDNGSIIAYGFDNTLFAATNIGSLATKSYEIQNLGKATLNLTGTPIVRIAGANPGDFVVTVFPSLTAITGGSSVSFSITFSPIYAGIRTALVSIANTDTDENPYTFLVQGTGSCTSVTNTLSLTSGPAGTEVTLTSTDAVTNNLTGATATFNGIAATVTPISASQIKVIVPVGATSGNLVVTNAQGCAATNTFTLITNAGNTCQGGNVAGDLFISEVTDSNYGDLTYVEIYNGTGLTKNLGGYSIKNANNGSISYTSLALGSVNLVSGSSYVLALGDDDLCTNPGGDGSLAAQSTGGLSINFDVNGNDHIALFKGSTKIDSWGTYQDSNWASSTLSIGIDGVTFRRKNTASLVQPITYNNSDWDIIDYAGTSSADCANNDYSDIGLYNFISGTPPAVTLQPLYPPSCKATSLTVAGTEGFIGGNALAYQWYGVAPNAATWTSLSDGGIYSGTSAVSLILSNLAGMDGYQFYCQIRENGASCYTATNAVKIIEAQTLTWNGSWSPSSPSPSLSTIVVINGDYNTSSNGNLNACSVIVNAGKTLEITADNYVNIQNDLTVNGVLRVLDKGSLIMIDDAGIVTNNGTAALHRFTTPFEQYDYTYWSTPIVSSDIATTFARWRTDQAYEFLPANFMDANNDGFDDDGNDWMKAGSMTPGKGYIIMGPTNESTYPVVEEVVFRGKFNNGVITTPVALTPNAATDDDFNLVGNPYPSAISADALIRANISSTGTINKTIEGTLYFWTHKKNIEIASLNPGPDSYNYSQDDYAMYNLSGGTGTKGSFIGGVEQSNRPLGYIASEQGFFVEADFTGTLTFNNSMRVGLPITANSQFYKMQSQKKPKSKDRFWLNMENSVGMFSQQLLCYFDETTVDYDQGYDGSVSESGNYVSFYSLINDGTYRIQGRDSFNKKDQVRLGYFSAVAGVFNINIDTKEGIFTNKEPAIYLEDKLLNVVHDLKQAPYSFTTEKGTFNDRFVLCYTKKNKGVPEIEDIDSQESRVLVSGKDKQIKISSLKETIDKVLIFDVAGIQIYQKTNVNSNELIIANLVLSHQVIVVKTVLQNGLMINKKIMF